MSKPDEKEKQSDLQSINPAAAVLKKNIVNIQTIINEVIAIESKEKKNQDAPPPSWAALRKRIADQLLELFSKKVKNEPLMILHHAVNIFFYQFDPQKFLLEVNNYRDIIPDIKEKMMAKLQTTIGECINEVEKQYKKNYTYKDADINLIFSVAEIIFYMISKFNFLCYQSTLTHEWCKIQQLKMEYLNNASENLTETSQQVGRILNPENKESEVNFLKKMATNLENYCKFLNIKKVALIQMMSTSDAKPLTAKEALSRWQNFIKDAKPKDELSPITKLQNKITEELAASLNLGSKLANDFDSIKETIIRFQSAPPKNDLSFEREPSIISSASFQAMGNNNSDIHHSLTEIKRQLPQTGYISRRVDKGWLTLYSDLEIAALSLNEQYDHLAGLYEHTCPNDFKSSTSRSERQKEYEVQYHQLKDRLQYYSENLQPLLKELKAPSQSQAQAIQEEQRKIAEIEKHIRELEEGFPKEISEQISQGGSPISVSPQINTVSELPRIRTVAPPATSAIIPSRPTIWCCLFPYCCGDTGESITAPLLTVSERGASLN